MKKATKITYNPFENTVDIQIASNANEPEWVPLAENSDLLQFANPEMKVLFSNIAEDVVNVVNDKQNSSEEGLVIQFEGPVSDFEILKALVNEANDSRPDKGMLTCEHIGKYHSADESLEIVKEAYNKISDEFVSYLPGNEYYEDEINSVGNKIIGFEEIISNEIPICVIGNYSVGKSAFINAMIGEEVLPSKVDASTSKNVKVVRNDEDQYTVLLEYKSEEEEKSSKVEFEILNSNTFPIIAISGPESDLADDLLEKLKSEASKISKSLLPVKKSKAKIMHDVLEVLNQTDPEGILKYIQWNVVITLPFSKSLLTDAELKN